MRLNAEVLRYMTKEEFRVLTAVEMGHKNHEFVPVPLIQSIASLKRHSVHDVITSLLKNKLLYRVNQKYEGLKLTYLGYDYLALHAFVKRGLLSGVGVRIGVGKESDIHVCRTTDGRVVVLKLHRLGRISFRSIKRNRDYLQRRQHASWMYLARLAALKEFFYLKALHAHKFPVPEPIDVNRHAVLMEYIDATPFREIKELPNPMRVLEKLMQLIVRLGRAGLIHGDFNEFNLMIDDKEHITFIDLPQVVSTEHPNAEMYFERDVECIRNLFARKYHVEVTEAPRFQDVCQASRPTGSGNSGTTSEQEENCDSKCCEKSLRVEDVLQLEELHAVDEALTESRRWRLENTDTEDNASCTENHSDTDFDAEDDSDDAVEDQSLKPRETSRKPRETSSKRRDEEEEAVDGDSTAQWHQSSHDSDNSYESGPDEAHNSSIRCYNPKSRKHDPKVVRKRVQQSERKKINHMGNFGQNKNPDRVRARRELARHY